MSHYGICRENYVFSSVSVRKYKLEFNSILKVKRKPAQTTNLHLLMLGHDRGHKHHNKPTVSAVTPSHKAQK